MVDEPYHDTLDPIQRHHRILPHSSGLIGDVSSQSYHCFLLIPADVLTNSLISFSSPCCKNLTIVRCRCDTLDFVKGTRTGGLAEKKSRIACQGAAFPSESPL